MDPGANEGTIEGERRPARNNPFRALNEDFNKSIHPSSTNTPLGAMHGTPSEGTSTVKGPALHFLHWQLRESPELEMEIARLHQTMMKEHEMLEEGLLQENEVEKEKAKRRVKCMWHW